MTILHFVWWDEPSARSVRFQKTVCRIWATPRETAKDRAAVTCRDCLEGLARLDAVHNLMNIDDER
jgi:hypothetical protein